MKNYTYLGISCILLLLTACTTQVYQNTSTPEGRVVMTVSDAAANLAGITSLKMTVNTVSLHSDAGGWVSVATPQRTYDLATLKQSGNNALLADLTLAPARYDQISMDVSSITVTDANGTYNAKMPSSTLRLNGEIVVLSNKTATASFDFIADQSLFLTTDAKYVFAPVIQLDTRTDASADTTSSDNVRLSGGTEQTTSRVGMDSVGNLVVGGTLPPILQINADGSISGTQNVLNNATNMTLAAPINGQDLNSRIPALGAINPNDLNSRIAP